jgi:hypothetical protein
MELLFAILIFSPGAASPAQAPLRADLWNQAHPEGDGEFMTQLDTSQRLVPSRTYGWTTWVLRLGRSVHKLRTVLVSLLAVLGLIAGLQAFHRSRKIPDNA